MTKGGRSVGVSDKQGLVAEFETVEELTEAIKNMRGRGYRDLDAHMPFPADEVIEALELPRSKVPLFVLIGGLVGMTVGYAIPYLTNVVDFPLNVGGRPDNAIPAFVPLVFETGVLFAATFGFFGYLWLCGLPRLWHPILEVEGFERHSTDRFFLNVESTDAQFDFEETTHQLEELSPLRVARYGGLP